MSNKKDKIQKQIFLVLLSCYTWIQAKKNQDKMSLVSLDDYEAAAIKKIPKAALDYYRGGAGNELSLQLNRTAFDRCVTIYLLKKIVI